MEDGDIHREETRRHRGMEAWRHGHGTEEIIVTQRQDFPTKVKGVESESYESAPDLTNLKKAIRRIGELAEKDFIHVEKCTVPA